MQSWKESMKLLTVPVKLSTHNDTTCQAPAQAIQWWSQDGHMSMDHALSQTETPKCGTCANTKGECLWTIDSNVSAWGASLRHLPQRATHNDTTSQAPVHALALQWSQYGHMSVVHALSQTKTEWGICANSEGKFLWLIDSKASAWAANLWHCPQRVTNNDTTCQDPAPALHWWYQDGTFPWSMHRAK